MITTLANIKTHVHKFIVQNPTDVFLIFGVIFFVLCFSVILTLSLIFKDPKYYNELPVPSIASINNKNTEWKFLSRQAVGKDYCDTYQKYSSFRVQCYYKNSEGKWILKDVF